MDKRWIVLSTKSQVLKMSNHGICHLGGGSVYAGFLSSSFVCECRIEESGSGAREIRACCCGGLEGVVSNLLRGGFHLSFSVTAARPSCLLPSARCFLSPRFSFFPILLLAYPRPCWWMIGGQCTTITCTAPLDTNSAHTLGRKSGNWKKRPSVLLNFNHPKKKQPQNEEQRSNTFTFPICLNTF
jgi:hypothetical protein